jgi:hypothetical protein
LKPGSSKLRSTEERKLYRRQTGRARDGHKRDKM